jgi:hypothetical protein
MRSQHFFLNKIESLQLRAKALQNLRGELALPAERDLRKEQWDALENQLSGVSNGLQKKLRAYTDRFLSESGSKQARQQFVELLGGLEMEVSQSYTFYDTYMDLLTQRLSQPIGQLLKGCDAIANDGLQRGFLADITLPPLVFCDRGFGAFTCREGVSLLPGVPNPIQFIAVPYARLIEKYNLISIYHEVGHQTLVKLNLVTLMQQVTANEMLKAGAGSTLSHFFANWMKELGPDFWAFCLTGMAQTCSLRDILFMPPAQAMGMHPSQQHPPPYLRLLISVAWCRHLWGKGSWDDWEQAWKEKYPLSQADSISRQLITQAEKFFPLLSRIFFDTKYQKLQNKPLTSLFSLADVAPDRLTALATLEATGQEAFAKKPLGVQLAAFRLIKENRQIKTAELDAAMQQWLIRIAR